VIYNQIEIRTYLARKPLYVCGSCGLDFTRSYNAKRHNKNLHDNKADIVTFPEYMIGTMSGKYPRGNPSLYRTKNRNAIKPNIVHQYENDNYTHFNYQKYVLNSTKTNAVYTLSARNQFDNMLESFERARESRIKQELEELINEIGRMLADFLTTQQVQAE
jgi:hypothetical protein